MSQVNVPHSNDSDGDIRRRAYELFQLRGESAGSELDDWLQAEREIQEREIIAPAPSAMAKGLRKAVGA